MSSPMLERLVAVACDQDCQALASLMDQQQLTPEQVHSLRVLIKRQRALWQLISTQGESKRAQKQDKALRAGARLLAASRDRQVTEETLTALKQTTRRDYELEALERVTAWLAEEQSDPVAPSVPEALPLVFQEDLDAWQALKRKGEDQDVIRKGYLTLYRQLRQQALETLSEGKDEDWHRLRRDVKYLQYQLEPLGGTLADAEVDIKRIRKLGSQLGDLHDLHMLGDQLKRRLKKTGDAELREALVCVRQLTARREERVMTECRQRTRRVFELKPKMLRQALEQLALPV